MIHHLGPVLERAKALAPAAQRRKVSEVRLRSPVANPSKIVNAPINYQKHIDEARTDPQLGGGRRLDHITDWGLFLKTTSALIGPGEPIRLRMPERRNDHEVELAVVIGQECRKATT
ncbi:MAG: fumarylacetoacetate hydrolase family protein, partial [Betaproteobacteria bacterium]|nr:fumarylacetoacetate hydrolase family protein [Betaproteobacteria bacterium]